MSSIVSTDRAEIASKAEVNFELRKRVKVCKAVERVVSTPLRTGTGQGASRGFGVRSPPTTRMYGAHTRTLFLAFFFFFAFIDTRTRMSEYVGVS